MDILYKAAVFRIRTIFDWSRINYSTYSPLETSGSDYVNILYCILVLEKLSDFKYCRENSYFVILLQKFSDNIFKCVKVKRFFFCLNGSDFFPNLA